MESTLEERRQRLELERLDLDERELALKRKRIEAEEAALAQPSAVHGSTFGIVKLNVGGVRFTTTRETLLNEPGSSFFRRLIGDSDMLPGASKDEEGCLFIDRDGDLFRSIVDWLRGGLRPWQCSSEYSARLMQEAEYFDLPRLQAELRGGFNPHLLSADDFSVLSDSREARERLRGEYGHESAAEFAASADSDFLVDVIAQRASFTYTGRWDSSAALLFASRREGPHEGVRPSTLSQFEERLDLFGGPLLHGLDWSNLVLAGGAVHACLGLGDPRDRETQRTARRGASDLDLFVVAPAADAGAGERVAQRVFRHLCDRLRAMATTRLTRYIDDNDEQTQTTFAGLHAHESDPGLSTPSLLVSRSQYALTFVVGWPQRHVQLILRTFSCVADVLLQFDVPSCQFAYDGKRVLATPAARRAMVTGVNVADPTCQSRTLTHPPSSPPLVCPPPLTALGATWQVLSRCGSPSTYPTTSHNLPPSPTFSRLLLVLPGAARQVRQARVCGRGAGPPVGGCALRVLTRALRARERPNPLAASRGATRGQDFRPRAGGARSGRRLDEEVGW